MKGREGRKKKCRDTAKHPPRRKEDFAVRTVNGYRRNKDLPWSVQMGYQFTIGLTPSKTRLTHGSTRIITSDRIAPRLQETQETSSPQFVQDGECATLEGPFLRARDQYNYVTLTKENRSHTDVPLVGGFTLSPMMAIAASILTTRFLRGLFFFLSTARAIANSTRYSRRYPRRSAQITVHGSIERNSLSNSVQLVSDVRATRE